MVNERDILAGRVEFIEAGCLGIVALIDSLWCAELSGRKIVPSFMFNPKSIDASIPEESLLRIQEIVADVHHGSLSSVSGIIAIGKEIGKISVSSLLLFDKVCKELAELIVKTIPQH